MRLIGSGLRDFLADGFPAPFVPRRPWIGGDLQTLRNSFVRTPQALEPDERLLAPIDVGAINLAVNYPPDRLSLKEQEQKILVLVHGLGGSETSSYMLTAARTFLKGGYTVVRMNYRGVGPSAETSEPPYSAGLTSDLRAVLWRVGKEMPAAAIYLMGFSLGGQLSLRMLGEGDVPQGLKACVSVSAPLDLAASQRKLERPRNRIYSRYVVNNMRNDLRGLRHPKVSADPVALTSVLEFDQKIIAPVFGFRDAADYYARVSCLPLLERIEVPSLAVHAIDDPWIPVEDYLRANWPANAPSGALVVPSGGHVGFHARGSRVPWHEQVALGFFERADLL